MLAVVNIQILKEDWPSFEYALTVDGAVDR